MNLLDFHDPPGAPQRSRSDPRFRTISGCSKILCQVFTRVWAVATCRRDLGQSRTYWWTKCGPRYFDHASPLELLSRLAALVPPRGLGSVRYHGVLAPRSKLRSRVVPKPSQAVEPSADEVNELALTEPQTTRPKRMPWAKLLLRVFRVDVEKCDCGGKLSSRRSYRTRKGRESCL